MICPYCKEDSGYEESYELIGEKVTCKACGKLCEVEYDESWDGEEEHQYWVLIKVE